MQVSHSIINYKISSSPTTWNLDRTYINKCPRRAIMEAIPLWSSIPGWILAVVAVVGNGLVIFLITTRPSLRTTTNWFVLSLAVADFGVGAVWYPRLYLCRMLNTERCDNVAVKIAFSIGMICGFASMTNLCALTLDRYLAIVHPLRYVTFMTKKRVALLVSAAWGVAFLLGVSYSVMWFALSGNPPDLSIKIWIYIVIVIQIFVVIVLPISTLRIFLVVRGIARRSAAVVAQLNFNHKLQHGVVFKARETASAKLIRIVVTVFVASYLWVTVIDVVSIVDRLVPQTMFDVSNVLMLLNSTVNPVAYAFHKREIKSGLKRLVRQRLHNEIGWEKNTKESRALETKWYSSRLQSPKVFCVTDTVRK